MRSEDYKFKNLSIIQKNFVERVTARWAMGGGEPCAGMVFNFHWQIGDTGQKPLNSKSCISGLKKDLGSKNDRIGEKGASREIRKAQNNEKLMKQSGKEDFW